MRLPRFLNISFHNVDSTLSKFLQLQEQSNKMFTAKLDEILQNQQASDEAIKNIKNVIEEESTQVKEAVGNLHATITAQTDTINQQGEQIKQLMAEVQNGNLDLDAAHKVIDQIIEKQREQLAAQQQATNQISAIFNPNDF